MKYWSRGRFASKHNWLFCFFVCAFMLLSACFTAGLIMLTYFIKNKQKIAVCKRFCSKYRRCFRLQTSVSYRTSSCKQSSVSATSARSGTSIKEYFVQSSKSLDVCKYYTSCKGQITEYSLLFCVCTSFLRAHFRVHATWSAF